MIGLILVVELRDQIYEYAGPTNESQPEDHIEIKHCPGLDADKITGFISTCRQIYEEYHNRNPRPAKVSLRPTDLNKFIETFFPSFENNWGYTMIHVIDLERLSLNHPQQPHKPTFTIEMMSLVNLMVREPSLKIMFDSEDLLMLTDMLASHRRQILSAPVNSIRNRVHGYTSMLSKLDVNNRLPDIMTVSMLKVTWKIGRFFLPRQDALFFFLRPEDATPWTDGDWIHTSSIKRIIQDLDLGLIPEQYFNDNEWKKIRFWKSMGLDKVSQVWRVWIGVEGQDDPKLFLPERLGLGWAWDHEEDSESESSLFEDGDMEEMDGESEEMATDDEELDYYEDENIGEELINELERLRMSGKSSCS